MLKEFKIIDKTEISPNIYEIIFETKENFSIIPGQFITFILPEFGGRAYSILKQNGNKTTLIIKKRELENGGRGGSKYICERKIGEKLNGVGPAGHFTLKENTKNKLFIGTGTGFVPLYNMIIGALNKKINCKLNLIFGLRLEEDVFYLDELKKLKKENSNFDFHIYISRVKDLYKFRQKNPDENISSGYTTNFLIEKNIKNYNEVYICGAPAMIEGAVEKLELFNFKKNENVFYEKY